MLTLLDEGQPVAHELLDGLLAAGVEGAAYVRYVPGPPEELIADVRVVAAPVERRRNEIRRPESGGYAAPGSWRDD